MHPLDNICFISIYWNFIICKILPFLKNKSDVVFLNFVMNPADNIYFISSEKKTKRKGWERGEKLPLGGSSFYNLESTNFHLSEQNRVFFKGVSEGTEKYKGKKVAVLYIFNPKL